MRPSFSHRPPHTVPFPVQSTKFFSSSAPPQFHCHQKRKAHDFTVHRTKANNTRRFRRRKLQRREQKDESTRPWVASSRDLSPYKDRFVIVSYNILGDDNASKHADLYEGVEMEDLRWTKRKRRICRELREYKPSILCFQEVDHFNDLAVLLEKDGFVGSYKGRTGEARDGCAIFWKVERFTLLKKENIEFQKYELRNNVAQLCVFKMHLNHTSLSNCNKVDPPMEGTLPSEIFIVCNIHVLFNPKRGDIKLGQVRMLLERAHILSQEWGNAPILIAGDLNSMPQSALYQFLSFSELDILLYDRRNISVQIEYPLSQGAFNSRFKGWRRYPSSMPTMKYSWSEEEIHLAVGTKQDTRLQHPLKLCSAYPGIPGNYSTRDSCGEPLATSYHSKFMGTVDYIWHTQELVPVRVLDTLPISTLKKTGGLPTQKWGSDHLALACEFAFVNNANCGNDLSDLNQPRLHSDNTMIQPEVEKTKQ